MTDDLRPLFVGKEASPVRNRRVGVDHDHYRHRRSLPLLARGCRPEMFAFTESPGG
jgi:hypothetical protein